MSLRPTPLHLNVEDRLKLEDILRSGRTSERVRAQCQILLLGDEGHPNAAIASQLNLTRSTVLKWRRRFRQGRFDALEAPRGPIHRQASRAERLRSLLAQRPPQGWTVRALADAAGFSVATVQRTLSAHGLTPNPRRPSGGVENRSLADVVGLRGLHMHAPFHVVVLEVEPGSGEGGCPPSTSPAEPGDPAWLLHLLLRSLEGLRQLEGGTPPSSFALFQFLTDLKAAPTGRHLWCLTDAPLPAAGLERLADVRPDIRIDVVEAGAAWQRAMRTQIIPALHARRVQGGCAPLDLSVAALERFIGEGAPDPFQWQGA